MQEKSIGIEINCFLIYIISFVYVNLVTLEHHRKHCILLLDKSLWGLLAIWCSLLFLLILHVLAEEEKTTRNKWLRQASDTFFIPCAGDIARLDFTHTVSYCVM